MGTESAGRAFGKNSVPAVIRTAWDGPSIGTVMVQFIIKIAAVNAAADVKTYIPSNFAYLDAKNFERF
jgi:hypothetical protein